jgi:hypothetical protein
MKLGEAVMDTIAYLTRVARPGKDYWLRTMGHQPCLVHCSEIEIGIEHAHFGNAIKRQAATLSRAPHGLG